MEGDADGDGGGALDKAVRSPLGTLARGTTWQLIGQVLPLVLNLVLTPYIIQGLGRPLYGIFMLVNVVQLFMGVVDGGVGPSANRFFTIYAGRDDKAATTSLLVTLLGIITVSTIVVFGAFFLATPTIISFFPVTHPDPQGAMLLLRVMVVLAAVSQIRGLFAYVLFAQHKFGVTTFMSILGHLVYAAGLVWTIEGHHGLAGIALTFIAQQAIATVFIIPSAVQHLSRSGVRLLTRAEFGDFWSYSWKVQLSSLLDVTTTQGDALVVGKFAAPQWDLFAVGSNFAQQLRMVPMNAFSPIQALVGRSVGAHGPLGAQEEYHRVQRLWVIGVVGWATAAAPGCYFALNHWLLRMGSPLPGRVAALLMVGHLSYLMSVIQIIWCLAVGRSDLELRYGLVLLVLNLSLTLTLVIPFGALGSVTATVIAQLLASLTLTLMMRRARLGTRSPWAIVPYAPAALCLSLSTLSCYAVSHAVGRLAGPPGLVVVGAAAAPALAIYLLTAIGPTQLLTLVKTRHAPH